MGSLRKVVERYLYVILKAIAFACFAIALSTTAHADGYQLAPYTKLRLTVLQWNSSKGEYLRWDAIGGEHTVSQAGTISVPLLGSIPVAKLDNVELATEVAKRLEAETGLISAPNVTVEVLEYPPIYVVGSVAAPGEYRFRPGMTVLQALALAGGRYRPRTEGGSDNQVGMLGDLEGVRNDINRSVARIARLRAEKLGAKKIEFPAELTEKSNDPSVAEVLAQERAILSSRESAQERQLATLTELRDLITAEINVLEEKAKTEDVGIKLAEDELARVGVLVEKGIATVSRKSDLELVLAGLKSDRLDRMTAIMRARQSLTEATRNAITVRDQRTTTVAAELQEAQANLAHLKVREEVLQRLVVAGDSTETNEEPDLVFTIVRQVDFESREIAASESTALSPGDVIKVSIRNPFEQPIKQRVNP